MNTDNQRDEMPRHNYDDKIEDGNVEKSYAFYNTDNQLKDITQGEWKVFYPSVNNESPDYNNFKIHANKDPLPIVIIPITKGYEQEAEANAKAIANLPNILKENEELKLAWAERAVQFTALQMQNEQLKQSNRELLKALNCIDQILKR